ncbi:MAG: hypothetical protein RMK29_06015 [Myxococcales bacterium]|nr:hypothetical protein [Myxococcota bacterium]MDW8281246.1 hypothetical protein [Myxococcales bacterium]
MTLRCEPFLSLPEITACCEVARWLYGPEEVWPYLRLEELRDPSQPPAARLEHLLAWLRGRAVHQPDPQALRRPQAWRAPGEVLWQGSGHAAELALCLWSAAPLVGLPRGRLAFGTCGDRMAVWAEWPELGLRGEPAAGPPRGAYQARFHVWPPLRVQMLGERNAA